MWRLFFVLLLATQLLATSSQDPRQSVAGGPLDRLPDTTDRIGLFADQLVPGASDRMVRFVATHFAGTQKMRRADNARYEAVNPRWLLLHYRLAVSSGPAQYIRHDAWRSDWTEVTGHEDWFLHNENGARHHDPVSNWDIHDVQNQGFRDYWVESVISDMRATGAQGVFADSFEAGVSGYGITRPDRRFAGTAPADPRMWPGGATWMKQKVDFADFVMSQFARTREKFVFVPNIGGLTTTWWWPRYENIDGAMLENYALGATPEDWIMSSNRALELTRSGKFIIVESFPKSVQERLFLFASYLLIKGNRTFINAGGMGVHYFPEYKLSFGPPLDALPDDVAAYEWQGVYKREFRDALALVNPGNDRVTAGLPRTFELIEPHGGGATTDAHLDANGDYRGGTLSYDDVETIVLAPRSAALLKRK